MRIFRCFYRTTILNNHLNFIHLTYRMIILSTFFKMEVT